MSNPVPSDRSTCSRGEIFDMLADESRREILRIAHERSPAGIEKTDLAHELATVTADKPLAAVTDDEHQRARVDCHHRALPALIGAGLLDETDADRIVTTDHWLFDDSTLMALFEGERSDYDGDLDGLFDALADSRRRAILTVLANQYNSLSTETLARDVAAREATTAERDVEQERVESVRTSLVHVHLPLLNDVGLVGYDAESETVSYEGHPALSVSWLDGESDPLQSTGNGSQDDSDGTDVRTLHGWERIVTTGKSLCE